MKKNKKNLGTQILIGILTVVALSLFAMIVFTHLGSSPYRTAKNNAIKIAQAEASLKTPTEFDIVNTDQTVYSLRGIDKDKKKIGVLISEDADGKDGSITTVKTVKLEDGVNPENLKDASTANYVRLGLYKDKVVWEVANSPKDYKLYDFESGKEVV